MTVVAAAESTPQIDLLQIAELLGQITLAGNREDYDTDSIEYVLPLRPIGESRTEAVTGSITLGNPLIIRGRVWANSVNTAFVAVHCDALTDIRLGMSVGGLSSEINPELGNNCTSLPAPFNLRGTKTLEMWATGGIDSSRESLGEKTQRSIAQGRLHFVEDPPHVLADVFEGQPFWLNCESNSQTDGRLTQRIFCPRRRQASELPLGAGHIEISKVDQYPLFPLCAIGLHQGPETGECVLVQRGQIRYAVVETSLHPDSSVAVALVLKTAKQGEVIMFESGLTWGMINSGGNDAVLLRFSK